MINFVKKQAVRADEVCSSGKLSASAKTETGAPQGGNRFGDEIIWRARQEPVARAQLKAAQRVEVSLRYMMQHLNQPMRVPVLSAMVGLSESSFFALFKSATGLTPLDFFIRARMQRAGELLEETTLQIKEVAARLGYDDQFYFSRLFRSVYGVPPREYRARKEEARDRKLKSTGESSSMSYLPSRLPGLVAARENQPGEPVLIGGFQPAMQHVKAFEKSCPESSAQISQTCSVSAPL